MSENQVYLEMFMLGTYMLNTQNRRNYSSSHFPLRQKIFSIISQLILSSLISLSVCCFLIFHPFLLMLLLRPPSNSWNNLTGNIQHPTHIPSSIYLNKAYIFQIIPVLKPTYNTEGFNFLGSIYISPSRNGRSNLKKLLRNQGREFHLRHYRGQSCSNS